MSNIVEQIIHEKWGNNVITGVDVPVRQPIAKFKNRVAAFEMLNKHLNTGGAIAVHTDVDVDGIGCAYIARRFFEIMKSPTNRLFAINKSKVHGINEKYIEPLKKMPLVIVLDSSTNEIEVIKQMYNDVLVIDHHEVNNEEELLGKTVNGTYVVINNMVENEADGYKVDEHMSCGLVLYEFFSDYLTYIGKSPDWLEINKLYQWSTITLFTDVIKLNTPRNMWYVDKTINDSELEPTIHVLINAISKYQKGISKSFINFTLAPLINKAIRAEVSNEILNCILREPQSIMSFNKHGDKQKKAVEIAEPLVRRSKDQFAYCNIAETDISTAYCGVIASKVCRETSLNTVCYTMKGAIASGSFRGRKAGVDYRQFFLDCEPTMYAQGHKGAFGFKIEEYLLHKIMEKINQAEINLIDPTSNVSAEQLFLTAGNVAPEKQGKYHLKGLKDLRENMGLVMIANANAKVNSDESLSIIVPRCDVSFESSRGKLLFYSVDGITCKAFEEINTQFVEVYIEYGQTMELFLRNTNIK